MRRFAALVLVVLAAAVALQPAAPARADGDPCSDYLLVGSLCPPNNPRPSQPQIDRTQKTIDAAKKAGYEIRVAVIGSTTDLGSVPVFFGRPAAVREVPGRGAAERVDGQAAGRDGGRLRRARAHEALPGRCEGAEGSAATGQRHAGRADGGGHGGGAEAGRLGGREGAGDPARGRRRRRPATAPAPAPGRPASSSTRCCWRPGWWCWA